MTEQLNAILGTSEGINLVLLIGLAILAGTVGARIIKALHMPRIIGYIATVTPEMPLAGALERTKKLDVEHLPVIAKAEGDKLVGVLNCRAVRRSLSAEVLARQQRADGVMS